jgi:polysaccharide deacetylase 2 family uncharacterized protein YibQ
MRLTLPSFPVDWRSPRLPGIAVGALLGGLALILVGGWLFGIEAPLRYAGVPEIEGVVPAEALGPLEQVALFGLDTPTSPPPPLVGEPADPAGPPLDADPDLLDWRDGLALPQIAADGRQPRRVYTRAVPATIAERALIALVVVDLGLDAERMEQSVLLPNAIGLAHTPYAAHLGGWQRHARFNGHEVLLELPLEAADHPVSDFGPWALRPSPADDARERLLAHVLGRSEAYFGLAAASEAFAALPERFAPIAAAIAGRGLGFVELGDDRLAEVAGAAGLAYASAIGPLDAVPEARAIDAALGRLEGAALRDGVAVGYVQSYPLTFDRLWHWSRTLDSKGISLVPVSRLLAVP